MNIQTIAVGLVSLVVAVLVVGLVGVPVIEDSMGGSPYSGVNTPDVKYTYLDESPNFTIVRSGSTVTTTIGDRTFTHTIDNREYPLITDSMIVRFLNNGTNFFDDTGTYHQSTQPDTVTVTITAVNGTVTVTNTAATPLNFSTQATMALIQDDSGTWGQYSAPTKSTLEQTVYFGNVPWEFVNHGPARLYSVVDGGTPTELIPPFTNRTSTVTQINGMTQTVAYVETGGVQAIGNYNGVTAVWTNDGTATTSTQYYIWAPIAFESTSTADEDVNTILLSIIPVLLFIVAIMVAIRLLKTA